MLVHEIDWTRRLQAGASTILLVVVAIVLVAAPAEARKCRKDAVQVGDACIDSYEASAWELLDPGDKSTAKGFEKGKFKSADALTGRAVQRGVSSDDYGAACPDDGSDCTNLYAASIPGVKPSTLITWFQALVACRNAGKRLATNQEWQAAALGVPNGDNGVNTCNTDNLGPGVLATGAREFCVSDVGAYDMVGNVWEWVADWVPSSTACPGWGSFSDDLMCLSGASTTEQGPGALIRGGFFNFGSFAGPLAVNGSVVPSVSSNGIGFRCARDQ